MHWPDVAGRHHKGSEEITLSALVDSDMAFIHAGVIVQLRGYLHVVQRRIRLRDYLPVGLCGLNPKLDGFPNMDLCLIASAAPANASREVRGINRKATV